MKRGADSLEIEGEDHLGDRRGDGEIQVRGLEWRAGGNGVESTCDGEGPWVLVLVHAR